MTVFKGGSPRPFNFRSWKWAAFLLAAFGFRVLFGLYCPPILVAEDEIQTYAIGLKCYTTHTWPYFGPDVQGMDTDFKTQIPGALEALLIAVPLKAWPVPESPYLFLNLLSFLALSLLAWYCWKRLPVLSPWFVFTWIYIAPWTLHYSTQIINPSYLVFGCVLFFLGFLETVPSFSSRIFPVWFSNFLMGFGLFWAMQLHMSWVLLAPFVLASLVMQIKAGTFKTACGMMALGALPMLALLAPTYLRYGFRLTQDIQGVVSGVNWRNIAALPEVAARVLSFASFEMSRFLGLTLQIRVDYLLNNAWLLLPGAFLWIAGICQPLLMVVLAATRRDSRSDWKAVRLLAGAAVLLVWASFWFTGKDPRSHTYYLVFPLVFVFSFYCWSFLASRPFWRKTAWVFLAAGIFFQAGYAMKTAQDRTSVYSQTKESIARAIQAGDYRLLAERRPHALY